MNGAGFVGQMIPSNKANSAKNLSGAPLRNVTATGVTGVSVIVVSYQTGDVLFDCIDSVLSAPDVDELVLVNHVNPAETVERLEAIVAETPKMQLLHSGDNLGFSRGCNLGAAIAQHDRFLFVNPDAVIKPGDAKCLAQTLDMHDEPTIVGCRLMTVDGNEQRGGRRGHLTLVSALGAPSPSPP